jgi:AcrR family transcriptional regulator
MAAGKLDRATIVAAALAILRERGLAAVSFRNLAAAVDAQGPSLYRHIGHKRDLYGLMSEQIFRQCLARIPECTDWRDWLRQFALVLWREQHETRDIRPLIMGQYLTVSALREFTDFAVRELTALGLDAATAFHAQSSVQALVTGWTMLDYHSEALAFEPQASFIRSLEALLRGWDKSPGRGAR